MAKQIDPLHKTRATLLGRLGKTDPLDQTSWKEFFDIYWRIIYGVARKTGLNDDEAQDVVQETLAAVAKRMPAFKYDPSIGSFKAWLLIKARWCAIDQFRKRIPTSGGGAQDDETATRLVETLADPNSHDFDGIWELEWQQNLLDTAKIAVSHRVAPEMFQAFDFYVNREWPAEKVAQRFNISVENLYVIKHRITALLKAEVTRIESEMV